MLGVETMGFNILKHELVPYPKILSYKEIKKLLKDYDIQKDQIPKLLITDPFARAIGAKEGDVVKIIRKSHTAGISIAYRLVVSPER